MPKRRKKQYDKPLDPKWRPSRVMLVDGNNIAHRALRAGQQLSDRKGRNTSMLCRFFTILGPLLSRFERYVPIIVWDNGYSEARCEYYPDYKAQRREKREQASLDEGRKTEADEWYKEFGRQQRILQRQALPYLGIPQLDHRGIEADDIIYYMTRKLIDDRNLGMVLSSDKDMFQCMQRGIQVYNHASHTILNMNTFEERTGMTPEQWMLYRCFKGDPSDNIKGVKGIGEKTSRIIVAEDRHISTPWAFMRSDCDSKEAVKLQARLVDDPVLMKDFKDSWRLQNLKHWYTKQYKKELDGVFNIRKLANQHIKQDFDAFDAWALKYDMQTLVYGDRSFSMMMKGKKKYWKYLFKRYKGLKYIPKELR